MQDRDIRQYQLDGTEFLIRHRRAIIADEMGIGKTLQVLDATEGLCGHPALIFATRKALYVWKNELSKWYGYNATVMEGKPHEREAAWKSFREGHYPALITTYAQAKNVYEKGFGFKTTICDEYDRIGLLNHRSDTFKNIKLHARINPFLFLVSGTPMHKDPTDFFAALNLIAPAIHRSYWKYIGDWCIRTKGEFAGYVIERRPKDIEAFKEMLREYMIRRPQRLVMPELPAKTRHPIPVMMTTSQRMVYEEMEREMFVDLTKYGDLLDTRDISIAQNTMVKIMRLRQCLVTPQLLGLNIVGGALEALPKFMESEFAEGNPVVVFTPFKKALPFIEDHLRKKLGNVDIGLISGDLSGYEVDQVRKHFQESKKINRCIICVIRSGEAIDLYTSNTCYFLGNEWDVTDHEQCEKRLHRSGQIKHVRANYLLHANTVDDLLLAVLNSKQQAMNWLFKPRDILDNIEGRVS